MTAPGWTVDGRTHRHEGYRIDPAQGPPPGGWVLHADDPPHPVIPSIDHSTFSSLKAAKAAAIHHRVLATQRIKLLRHVVVAVMFTIAAMPAFALMGPGTSTRRVVFFALGLVCLMIAIREMVGIVVTVFNEGWDYAYDLPRVTKLDAVVADIASAILHAQDVARTDDDEEPVHVVELQGWDPGR